MLAEDTYENIDEALNLIDDAAGDMSGVGLSEASRIDRPALLASCGLVRSRCAGASVL